MIGAAWTAGNRLERTRPNGQGGICPVGAQDLRTSWWARWSRRGQSVSARTRGRAPDDNQVVGTAATPERMYPLVGACGVSVAESALDPPGPIPNPVVTRGSAGEYCGGDPVGGEAVAGTPRARTRAETQVQDQLEADDRRMAGDAILARGGAVAARWAHNPKVGGSNPSPATSSSPPHTTTRPRQHVLARSRRVLASHVRWDDQRGAAPVGAAFGHGGSTAERSRVPASPSAVAHRGPGRSFHQSPSCRTGSRFRASSSRVCCVIFGKKASNSSGVGNASANRVAVSLSLRRSTFVFSS